MRLWVTWRERSSLPGSGEGTIPGAVDKTPTARVRAGDGLGEGEAGEAGS